MSETPIYDQMQRESAAAAAWLNTDAHSIRAEFSVMCA